MVAAELTLRTPVYRWLIPLWEADHERIPILRCREQVRSAYLLLEDAMSPDYLFLQHYHDFQVLRRARLHEVLLGPQVYPEECLAGGIQGLSFGTAV
jgi:hypothetical protein